MMNITDYVINDNTLLVYKDTIKIQKSKKGT